MLICGGNLLRDDGGRAFAFKLHQFIGQGRALFATLEPPDQREFSLEGQVQAGGGRIFVPIKFCRQCGQDYYHVLRSSTRFLPHPVGLDGDGANQRPGCREGQPPPSRRKGRVSEKPAVARLLGVLKCEMAESDNR